MEPVKYESISEELKDTPLSSGRMIPDLIGIILLALGFWATYTITSARSSHSTPQPKPAPVQKQVTRGTDVITLAKLRAEIDASTVLLLNELK